MEKVIVPRATELWDTKVLPEGKRLWDTNVLPGGKRLARRFLRPKQADVPQGNGDIPNFATKTANAFAIWDTAEISTVQEGYEDSPLADVIQMNGYQNRWSA